MKPSVAAIVLAAGASRRLGQPKQLVMFDGETLLGRTIRLASESGAAPVIVVLGANHERISRAVTMDNVTPVINDHWEQGISSSIHAGLTALTAADSNVNGAMILACDQPRLTSDHLRALLEAFANQPSPCIVSSSYLGVLGIPAIFSRAIFSELFALRGDKGARSLLLNPPCPLIAVPFSGGELDIDSPEDLAELA